MKFFYINIFLLFVSLRHFISLYKDYDKKYIYKNEIYNSFSFFNLNTTRSLAEYGKKEFMKRTLTRSSLRNDTILNDKLRKRNDGIDNRYNVNQMYENLPDRQEWNYGSNKKLNNEFEKYYIKNNSLKSISGIMRLKNWLYRKMFKECSFRENLSMFASVLGVGAFISMFNMLCTLIVAGTCAFSSIFIGIFAVMFVVFSIIIIILFVMTRMLFRWLRKYTAVYNGTCGK
ncbi:Plasmodium exported protein (hyp15), unknown function [Plasmodium reichenowi]|uniref:Exported protein (Hyp15) n=2 Tax=Plasmodium reichenowi TaxID=5854 RepID=A0A2P9DT20_PLARE|nr:Plasmodium exported protein (hyp15), unknown function [Plasmodium reichenowi]